MNCQNQADKAKDNLYETAKLKQKVRNQAKKILMLASEKKAAIDAGENCRCLQLSEDLQLAQLQVAAYRELLKAEVHANELLRTILESSAQSLLPVSPNWRDLVPRPIDQGHLLEAEERKSSRPPAEAEQLQATASQVSQLVNNKAETDRRLLLSAKEIENLRSDVGEVDKVLVLRRIIGRFEADKSTLAQRIEYFESSSAELLEKALCLKDYMRLATEAINIVGSTVEK